MRKNILVLFILLGFCFSIEAQNNNESVPLPKSLQSGKTGTPSERKVKFFVGGQFGFDVGTYLSINLSPHVGVMPCDYVAIGVGGTYMFSRTAGPLFGTSHSDLNALSHIFGANAFVEGLLFNQSFIIHGEYEYLSYPGVNDLRFNNHAALLGGGYNREITRNLYTYALVLFTLWSSENIYAIPTIRIGINYKF